MLGEKRHLRAPSSPKERRCKVNPGQALWRPSRAKGSWPRCSLCVEVGLRLCGQGWLPSVPPASPTSSMTPPTGSLAAVCQGHSGDQPQHSQHIAHLSWDRSFLVANPPVRKETPTCLVSLSLQMVKQGYEPWCPWLQGQVVATGWPCPAPSQAPRVSTSAVHSCHILCLLACPLPK